MDTVVIGGKTYMYPANIKLNPIPSVVPSDVEITRIDFIILEGGRAIVNKLGRNDVGRFIVLSHVTKDSFNLADALSWCISHGWTVRQWPGGARAFKNGLEPIRNKFEIIRLRDELRDHPRPELEGTAFTLDLAYDL